MSDSIYEDLKKSLTEAVLIKEGKVKPAKVTRYSPSDVQAIRSSHSERDDEKKSDKHNNTKR